MRFAHTQMKKVPILMYHSISGNASSKFRQFTVSPALFAEQMAYLHQQAYTPITVTQYVRAQFQRETELPEHPIVLTFDDGFADFLTAALPVLTQYNFAATLYVSTAFVGGTSRWLRREEETGRLMLTWEQLAEISSCGIECGAHSHNHRQLDILPNPAAWDEIMQSKKL
ncbi:MAG: polysaccharide deacetylase family protein, partial [Chloroflexi bacterium]